MWTFGASRLPTWAELHVMIHKVGLDTLHVAQALGSPPAIDNIKDAWAWLQNESEPGEVLGYLRTNFNTLPNVDREEAGEQERNDHLDRHYDEHQTFEKIAQMEWQEVADLPALAWETPPTEQEERLGIMVRLFSKGQYRANDLLGMFVGSWGGRPREALADVYMQLTNKLPYHV